MERNVELDQSQLFTSLVERDKSEFTVNVLLLLMFAREVMLK
jgi:hypothetical protein